MDESLDVVEKEDDIVSEEQTRTVITTEESEVPKVIKILLGMEDSEDVATTTSPQSFKKVTMNAKATPESEMVQKARVLKEKLDQL